MPLARRLLAFGAATLALLWASCKQASPDDGAWGGGGASCRGLAMTCGPTTSDDCCRSLPVPGGTFNRGYDGVLYLSADFPATVSEFHLDTYEVTVGRFRAFVKAGLGTRQKSPAEGSGAHPRIPGSGWRSTWTARLPSDTAALEAALACHPDYQSWTDTPGANEGKPVNCLDWYTAFAFCAWDGGRLPSHAEWNYAASGGNEHRYYPWSSPPSSTIVDDSYAVYCGGTCRLQAVGSRSPKGDGRWGHSDLGGNVWEWTLDFSPNEYQIPCHDCAEVTTGAHRVFLGGSNDDIDSALLSASRHVAVPEYRGVVGVRCARDP